MLACCFREGLRNSWDAAHLFQSFAFVLDSIMFRKFEIKFHLKLSTAAFNGHLLSVWVAAWIHKYHNTAATPKQRPEGIITSSHLTSSPLNFGDSDFVVYEMGVSSRGTHDFAEPPSLRTNVRTPHKSQFAVHTSTKTLPICYRQKQRQDSSTLPCAVPTTVF